MSEGALTPFTPAGVPTDEFAALLDKGKQQGELTPDDLMQVLERVELSSEVINAVKGRVQAEGIVLVDEDVDDELDPEDPEVHDILREVIAAEGGLGPALPGVDGDQAVADDPIAEVLVRAPGPEMLRPRPVARFVGDSGNTGPSSDYVRMYLK